MRYVPLDAIEARKIFDKYAVVPDDINGTPALTDSKILQLTEEINCSSVEIHREQDGGGYRAVVDGRSGNPAHSVAEALWLVLRDSM